jgi:hypothetical protein
VGYFTNYGTQKGCLWKPDGIKMIVVWMKGGTEKAIVTRKGRQKERQNSF